MKVARDGARCRRFDVPAPLSEDEVKAVADRAEAVAGQRLERVQAGCAWEPALEALAALGNHDLVVPVAVLGAILWSILRALMRG